MQIRAFILIKPLVEEEVTPTLTRAESGLLDKLRYDIERKRINIIEHIVKNGPYCVGIGPQINKRWGVC